jgi:LacI family transcriptional regulator
MIVELVDTHSAHVERELGAALAALHPDGVILTPPHGDNPIITGMLTGRHIPFARIGSTGTGPGFAISMDDRRAAAAAAEHLLAIGHRRIGFITGSDDYALSGARLEGYREAMRSAGLPEASDLVARGDFTFASGAEATRSLLALAERPTAVIASSDQMSLAALEVARSLGFEVPRDLSIISFDDTPIVKFSVPPLTAIRQPIAPMAARAADLLIQAANGELASDAPNVLPFELIVRGSTAAPS